ncbi:MAG: hypothetical protein AAFV07_21520, partial [Bacteroidota bacterium]
MQRLVPLFVILLIGWLAGGTWFWVCKVRGLCDGDPAPQAQVETPAVQAPSTPAITFAANYDGKPLFETPDPIRFGRNSALGRLTPGAGQMLQNLVSWLKEHPDTDLEITGRFAAGEPAPEGALNMGLARVGFLKDWLADKGLDPNRIIATYEQLSNESGFNAQDTLIKGIGLKVLDREPVVIADGGTEAESAGGNFETKTVYFDFNSDYIPLDADLRAYITQTIQYLRQHPDNKLALTGHTDGSGEASRNMVLGRKR